MSVSANALTLAQYAIQSNDPLVMKITDSLLHNGSILNDLPIANKKTLIANGVRWEGSLPTPNWSKLNVDPVVTSGTPTPYQEQAYVLRTAVDVDRFFVEDENAITDPRGVQVGGLLTAVGYDVNDKFINNDPMTGNSDAFVGARYRIGNGSTYGVNSDLSIDGSIDLSGTISAANANKLIETVQKLLDFLGSPAGEDVVLYMNSTVKRKFATAVRTLGNGGGWEVTRDAYNRVVERFNGAIVRDIGRKANQSTYIITDTEDTAGAAASSTYSSIYGIRYGENGLMGWQFEPLAPKDIQLIGNGGSTYRMLIDWAVGLLPTHTRCMGRIYDIKVA